jgi:hypothetical protein
MISSTWLLVATLTGALLAIGCLIGGFRALWKKRLLSDNPTSKTQGVFIGLVEIKGTAEIEKPLVSYLAEIPCVQYAYKVQEHWSRTVTETYTDGKGHVHTRTRTESGWKTVADSTESAPFYLKDDTGILRILPEGAKIEGKEVFDKNVRRDDPLYFGKCPASEVANSTHRRRFQETAVPLHAVLYVVGQARERADIVAAEIAKDKSSPMFIISTRTERQVTSGFNAGAWGWTISGLVLSLGIAVTWQFLSQTGTIWIIYTVAGGSFLLAFLLGWVWTVYNSFINLHNRVAQGWSQIDVQLKRRNDLIPNLVQVVEGYRTHEKESQTLIAGMRNQMIATPPGVTGPDFTGLAPQLKAVVENYPDLKANEQFLKLQNGLVETEQRIALARDYYNQIATFYNSRLEMVPDRFIGALARLRPRTLMSATDFERAPVKVDMGA